MPASEPRSAPPGSTRAAGGSSGGGFGCNTQDAGHHRWIRLDRCPGPGLARRVPRARPPAGASGGRARGGRALDGQEGCSRWSCCWSATIGRARCDARCFAAAARPAPQAGRRSRRRRHGVHPLWCRRPQVHRRPLQPHRGHPRPLHHRRALAPVRPPLHVLGPASALEPAERLGQVARGAGQRLGPAGALGPSACSGPIVRSCREAG
jgi:hypothetical protein